MKRKLMILMLAVALPTLAFSQCKRFAKNTCIPALGEYVPNDNFNSAVLIPGDEAELSLTFYTGQEYRVMVCYEEILEQVNYKMFNSDGEQIFDSETSQEPHLDFSVANTQKVKLVLKVPEQANTNDLYHEGCATVMVGFKAKDS